MAARHGRLAVRGRVRARRRRRVHGGRAERDGRRGSRRTRAVDGHSVAVDPRSRRDRRGDRRRQPVLPDRSPGRHRALALDATTAPPGGRCVRAPGARPTPGIAHPHRALHPVRSDRREPHRGGHAFRLPALPAAHRRRRLRVGSLQQRHRRTVRSLACREPGAGGGDLRRGRDHPRRRDRRDHGAGRRGARYCAPKLPTGLKPSGSANGSGT